MAFDAVERACAQGAGRRSVRRSVASELAAALGLLGLSDHQVGTLNIALGSVFELFARTLVTPLARRCSRHGHP
jgi:hypothetical protein